VWWHVWIKERDVKGFPTVFLAGSNKVCRFWGALACSLHNSHREDSPRFPPRHPVVNNSLRDNRGSVPSGSSDRGGREERDADWIKSASYHLEAPCASNVGAPRYAVLCSREFQTESRTKRRKSIIHGQTGNTTSHEYQLSGLRS